MGAALSTVILPVKKWDPRKSGDGTITYIDLSSVDRETKSIAEPSLVESTDAPSRARQLVSSGDVIVSTVRPNLNAVAVVPPELDGATASTGFCILRPKADQLASRYLFHWVKSPGFVADMVRKATGASYPAVSDKVVKASRIPLPPIEEQRRIAAVLDAADELRAKRREALAKLDTLAQAIFIDMFGDPVTNPLGWRSDRVLSDVADVRSGITKGRKTGDVPLTEVPYLAVANVQDGHLKLDNVKTIGATPAELNRYSLRAGDVVLTEGGDPDKLGRGTVWSGELEACIHQNHVFRVRVIEEGLTPQYVSRLLGSQRGKRYFLRMAKQTTGIASINMTQLREFPLLEPPIALQREFLDRVGAVESLAATGRESSDNLGHLVASLQQRAFRGEL